jgi:hypothetical protein
MEETGGAQTPPLTDLPVEIVVYLCTFLDVASLVSFGCTGRSLFQICKDRALCRKHFVTSGLVNL